MNEYNGTEGQDRESYTDTQDRESYVPTEEERKLLEPTNKERAEFARAVLESSERYKDHPDGLSDMIAYLIADLMHLANQNNINPDDVISLAQFHFNIELENDSPLPVEEVPKPVVWVADFEDKLTALDERLQSLECNNNGTAQRFNDIEYNQKNITNELNQLSYKVSNPFFSTCDRCNGLGKIVDRYNIVHDNFTAMNCGYCNGRGKVLSSMGKRIVELLKLVKSWE